MKKFLLFVVLSLIMSSGGYYYGKSSSLLKPADIKDKTVLVGSSMETNLEELTSVDLQEYLNLKSQKEKYTKANDILQKILKLFLLDLGLRLSDKNHDLLRQDLMLNDEPSKTNDDNLNRQNSLATPAVIKTANNGSHRNIVGSKEWTNKEVKSSEVSTDDEIKTFLKSVEIDDFFKSLKSLGHINQKQVSSISGSFWGKVNFDDNNKESWDVEIDIEDTSENNKLSANTEIKLFKNGKRFSRSTGDGEFKNFKSLSGSKLAIIVDAYGGSGFFQLYQADKARALIGNYYHSNSIAIFKKIGTVRLEPR